MNNCTGAQVVNSLYSYDMKDGYLVNPRLLLRIPFGNTDIGLEHIGGKITLGPDQRIYITGGDGYPCRSTEDCKNSLIDGALNSKTANSINGSNPNGLGGILVFTQEFDYVNDANVGEGFPSNFYYAYGIRNSFGLDFDPVTGNLWDTENGPYFGDEINLVESGFNSGWKKVQGKAPPDFNNSELVTFEEKGKYSDPEFSWTEPVGPTKIKFLSSDNFGEKYENDLFQSDIKYGRIYHFDLNEKRDG